mgnify:CR=1 FL=1
MSQVTDSVENYLESIYVLRKKSDCVRSIDIVRFLGFSKPSVSVAMRKLRESGHIKVSDKGCITLLPKGEVIAEETYKRHVLMRSFLIHIGVSSDTADEDACKMEHDLSDESFLAICGFIEDGCPLHMKNAQQKKQEPPRPVQESIDPALL